MVEAKLHMGSVVIFELSDLAWRHLGEGDHYHVITQLYLNGAVSIGASLIQSNRIIGCSSFEPDSIYEIIERLSLVKMKLLAQNGMSGMIPALEKTYDDPPINIRLKTVL